MREGKTMEQKTRYDIYREVQHELYMEDAARHVEEYLSWASESDSIVMPTDLTFDYDELATAFEENHDCNIADNGQWDQIIDSYVQRKEREQSKVISGKNSLKQNWGKVKSPPGRIMKDKER